MTALIERSIYYGLGNLAGVLLAFVIVFGVVWIVKTIKNQIYWTFFDPKLKVKVKVFNKVIYQRNYAKRRGK